MPAPVERPTVRRARTSVARAGGSWPGRRPGAQLVATEARKFGLPWIEFVANGCVPTFGFRPVPPAAPITLLTAPDELRALAAEVDVPLVPAMRPRAMTSYRLIG